MPGSLFAAIAAPMPVPQTMMPRSAWPVRTGSQTLRATSGKSTGSPSCVPTSSTSCPHDRSASTTGPFNGNPA